MKCRTSEIQIEKEKKIIREILDMIFKRGKIIKAGDLVYRDWCIGIALNDAKEGEDVIIDCSGLYITQ